MVVISAAEDIPERRARTSEYQSVAAARGSLPAIVPFLKVPSPPGPLHYETYGGQAARTACHHRKLAATEMPLLPTEPADPSSRPGRMPRPPAELDATILVVSFNTRELTLRCLESIQEKAGDLSYEVIVADNASRDGSAEAIAREFPGFGLLALEQNLGFGAANNLASLHARGRCIVLLNPDTEVQEGAIERVVSFIDERPGAGLAGGRTINEDGSLNPTSCWAAPGLWSVFCTAALLSTAFPRNALFDPTTMGRWARDTEREVDIISGCFVALGRDLWDELGGFDPVFFMYGEDVDLSLRARRLGYRPRINPEACVLHRGAASEPVKEDKLVRLLRAQRQVIRLHWPTWKVLPGLWMHSGGVALRAAIHRAVELVPGLSSGAAARAWSHSWRRRREWLGGAGDTGR